MGNYATEQAITDNLKAVLEALGVQFSAIIYEPENLPAGLIPFGQMLYEGAAFEDTFNQRPSYVDMSWRLRVIFRTKEQADLIDILQDWTSRLRGALTVDALNTGALSAALLVSRVSLEETSNTSINTTMAALLATVFIRYRET